MDVSNSHRSPSSLDRDRSRKAGFSLVDVMVAMVVLLIVAVGLAQLLAMTIRIHLQAESTAETTRLAQGKIDELTTLNFGTEPSIQITSADVLNADIPNYFDTPATGITRRWSVVAGPTATTRLVTVRVIDGTFGERTVDLTTVVRQ